MWNITTKTRRVTLGATETIIIQKILEQHTPGKHEDKELQKTAILGTAHVLRKVIL
jgi:hypothetical protein